MMARMLRNLVGVKPNASTDDLKRYVGKFLSMMYVSNGHPAGPIVN